VCSGPGNQLLPGAGWDGAGLLWLLGKPQRKSQLAVALEMPVLPQEHPGAGTNGGEEGREVAGIVFWHQVPREGPWQVWGLHPWRTPLPHRVWPQAACSVFEISLRVSLDRRPPECPSRFNYSVNEVGNGWTCCLGVSCLFRWWERSRPPLLEQSSAPDLPEAAVLPVWWPLASPFPRQS